MRWSDHFPTLLPFCHRVALWYGARDLFERATITAVGLGGVLVVGFFLFFAAPAGYPTGAYINVEEGMPLQKIASMLEERGVINNAALFSLIVRTLGDDRHLPAGEYFFSRQENMFWVAERLIAGSFEVEPVRITIPEGLTVKDIAHLLLIKIPEFNYREFVDRAREGYMFPDTYFFRPGQSTDSILAVFDNNFNNKMLKIQKEANASGHTLDELLTMASILEKEASKTQDRQMISGVLWHRIAIKMPLQVDAVFPYLIGKNTFQLTLDDLQIDSPYNTYKYKGLPPGPIDNPGLDSILAAAKPTKNNYVFFLSDANGNFHFATTYDQHLANKKRYLN